MSHDDADHAARRDLRRGRRVRGPVPGVASDGATEDEARANVQDALLLYFDEPTADEPIPWWGVPASRS